MKRLAPSTDGIHFTQQHEVHTHTDRETHMNTDIHTNTNKQIIHLQCGANAVSSPWGLPNATYKNSANVIFGGKG